MEKQTNGQTDSLMTGHNNGAPSDSKHTEERNSVINDHRFRFVEKYINDVFWRSVQNVGIIDVLATYVQFIVSFFSYSAE